MTTQRIRTTIDEAMMRDDVLRYRRNNYLTMRGWQNIDGAEGVKLLVSRDGYDLEEIYSVITLTSNNEFKVNIIVNGSPSDIIDIENKCRKAVGVELLDDSYDDPLDAVTLALEIIEYWGLCEPL